LITCLFVLPAHAKYSGGTGEPNDPYQIATAADLIALGETPEDYDKHFILTADIDLDPNLPGRKVFDKAVIAPGWGTLFTGVFDGNGHTISHLTIIGGCQILGLFGHSGAYVKNLGVVDVNVIGSGSYVGGLVGHNAGSVTDCYSMGVVSVEDGSGVGGLVGVNWGQVIRCYSTGVVSGNSCVGGLVGVNYGELTQCYSTTTVIGTGGGIGGLVGVNDDDGQFIAGIVTQCYSAGLVSGNSTVGGLVGLNNGFTTTSFWDTQTSGQNQSAGGTGKTTAEMQDPNTFMAAGWDLVGQPDGPSDIWAMPEGGGYPILWWQLTPWPELPGFSGGSGEPNDPYLIATAEQLNSIGYNPRLMTCHFKLVRDLDLTGVPFYPIGSGSFCPYTGVFEGHGHEISHLTITGEYYLGLFGCLGSGAQVKDLGVVDVNIIGTEYPVGGLVGANYGTVTHCYSTGVVSGNSCVGGLVGVNCGELTQCYSTGVVSGSHAVGGLVGGNYGELTQCYSTGVVSGSSGVGGLVGYSYCDEFIGGIVTQCYSSGSVSGLSDVGGLVGSNDGSVTRCYSTGAVSGDCWVGGLVGNQGPGQQTDYASVSVTQCYSTGAVSGRSYVGGLVGGRHGMVALSVTGCFWDTQTSGQATSDGGTGKTTAEMQTASTFVGWSVCEDAGVWTIDEGSDYPRLAWEHRPGKVLTARLSDFLTGSGSEDDPYLIYTASDIAIISHVSCEQDKHFRLAFLAGGGTENDPYLIRTADQIDLLNKCPYERDAHYRLIFMDGEGTPENPYLIYTADQIDLLNRCPYERDAHYRLIFMDGEGTPENPYLIYTADQIDLLNKCPRSIRNARYSYIWNARYRLAFVEGEGSEDDPYLIRTADQLELIGMCSYERAANFKLVEDIDLDPNLPGRKVFDRAVIAPDTDLNDLYSWQGIRFSGVFDGNDHTISHLTIKGGSFLGLFGALASGAQVMDLGVVDVNITASGEHVGGLAGENYGAVTNCYSTGVVSGTRYRVGGLVGSNGDQGGGGRRGGTVTQCYSTAAVSGEWLIGGLVGCNGDYEGTRGGTVTQCYSTGSVTGEYGVGGLVGENYHSGDITASYSTSTVSGTDIVGGLVGYNSYSSSIAASYSTGAVSGDESVGGLVGKNGGYSSYTSGSITGCYSTGSVSGTSYVGGFVGYNCYRSSIAASYSTGSVSGDRYVGGLMGCNRGSVDFCFWDIETSGVLNMCGVQGDDGIGCDDSYGKVTAEMQTATTFLDAGWDFVGETANGSEDIWKIAEGLDYPRLWWETTEE